MPKASLPPQLAELGEIPMGPDVRAADAAPLPGRVVYYCRTCGARFETLQAFWFGAAHGDCRPKALETVRVLGRG